jgi:VCBS repeat protein
MQLQSTRPGPSGQAGGVILRPVRSRVRWAYVRVAVVLAIATAHAVTAGAQTNALLIESQAGEPVGAGRRRVWVGGEVSIEARSAYETYAYSVAEMWVTTPETPQYPHGTGRWSILFRAPNHQPLRPGVYENARSTVGTSDAETGLDVYSPDGRCPQTLNMTGRFIIYEITFAQLGVPQGDPITSIAADFEQRCGPGEPALVGSVRYNSSRSNLTPFSAASVAMPHARHDINGDRQPDLVWQNRADGRLGAWFMRGTDAIDNAFLMPEQVPDPAWHIVGVGDGNRDGLMDLYWQHQTSGALAIWFMNERYRVSAESLSPGSVADTQWKVRTVTDLDRDGDPDLIWQHTGTGAVAVWFMRGLQSRSAELLVPGQVGDLNWTIVAAGDVNRDGNPDLFWHHAVTGQLAVWFMRGGTALSGASILPDRVPDTAWRVRGAGDLDGNGYPDLIWQNTTTLQVGAWLMNGLRLIDGLPVTGPALPNADWHIVGPK